ncbi:hypothetical protein Q5P01_008451 [Channa striata]|uniref:G protein-regulated inducer of neurite outgrowth C-terminal domain-containing protein n=1 Tax=Channa striata TaxID=64152 RepID=A0AA88MZL9_CHASR|nr:hypothetical protein Q5P01_008451 [Channa striata]
MLLSPKGEERGEGCEEITVKVFHGGGQVSLTEGQEEPKEAVGGSCKDQPTSPPSKEVNCSSQGAGGEPAEQTQSSPGHCAPCQVSRRDYHKTVANATYGRNVPSIRPALPVQRSHSDKSPATNQAAHPHLPDSDTCGLGYHEGDKSLQEAEGHSMLACKQPMQLQQCSIVTTVCCGASSAESGAQQPQSRCICSSSPKRAVKVDGAEQKGFLPVKCDKLLCYGSYFHHANIEDTFAAYCHPQPIPAPSQLLPRLAGVEPAAPPTATNHLTLPRLISSVSETGLDGKHLLRCCNLSCSLMSSLPPAGQQTPKHFSGNECCASPVVRVGIATRNMGTMTVHKELRDVGVQTGQSDTPHVFPQICLSEETSYSQTNPDSDGGKKPGGAPKSPVKEVKWDSEGMTWEVYGASVDPEELGLAIQRHLELQIKETASRAAKLSRQNTNTSRQSGNTSCQRKKSRILGSIRSPACCTRTTTAVD